MTTPATITRTAPGRSWQSGRNAIPITGTATASGKIICRRSSETGVVKVVATSAMMCIDQIARPSATALAASQPSRTGPSTARARLASASAV